MAVSNLIVQATAFGLYVHQMAGFSVEKVRETYSLPEGFEPVAAIAIGYPDDPNVLPEQFRQQEIGPRQRKPIVSFIFETKWGETSPLVK
jgi:nitroreductase